MFRSRRERILWIATGVYFAFILATLTSAQQALTWLRERNLLRLTLLAFFVAMAVVLVAVVAVSRPGWRESLAVVGIGAGYALLLSRMEILQERLHIPEYGLLALGLHAALAERFRCECGKPRAGKALLLAGALTGCAGWIDEAVQGILPSRVYDLRDVGFNAGAGALALAALTLRRLAREGDRTRRVASAPGGGD